MELTTNEKIIKVAEKFGWKLISDPTMVLQFRKKRTEVWRTREGWQVADRINSEYVNHRPATNIMAAISGEAGTPYIDHNSLLDELLEIGDYAPKKGDPHPSHCYQGEYEDMCKYNDKENCTARIEQEPITKDVAKGIQLVEDLIKDMRAKWLHNNLSEPASACDVILQGIRGKYFDKMVRDAVKEYTDE